MEWIMSVCCRYCKSEMLKVSKMKLGCLQRPGNSDWQRHTKALQVWHESKTYSVAQHFAQYSFLVGFQSWCTHLVSTWCLQTHYLIKCHIHICSCICLECIISSDWIIYLYSVTLLLYIHSDLVCVESISYRYVETKWRCSCLQLFKCWFFNHYMQLVCCNLSSVEFR